MATQHSGDGMANSVEPSFSFSSVDRSCPSAVPRWPSKPGSLKYGSATRICV